jgi:hypothetical protein
MRISIQRVRPVTSVTDISRSSIVFSCILACLLLHGVVSGQTVSSITGTVTDSSGAVVPDANVSVTNDSTGVKKTAASNSAGSFTITDLLPGTHTVEVTKPGFQSSVLKGIGVEVAHAATVNVLLQTGSTSQTIEVQESAIALDTTQPDLNTTIENKVVMELPNEVAGGRGRQIDSFVFLAPGVTGSSFSKRVNGGVDFQSEVVFNGIPMAQSETQGFQTIWNPPFELTDEFNVLRSSFSAQYGLAQGVITYHTASGTNQIHGDGFEIIRNNFFDAKGAYQPTVPIDKENNYGFSVGGPVFIPHLYNGKNKTFFYLSMEWYRENQTSTGTFSLPTAAEKNGDFSALGVTIYNPVNSGCNANGNTPGTAFRGNVIPQVCFSPNSQGLLQYIPSPTLPGFQNNANNLEGVLPVRQNPWGFNIDHTISEKQSIHFAMWRDKQTSYGDNTGTDLQQSNPLADKTYYPDLGTVFILNYAYTVNPHLVITAGGSWLGELNFQLPERTGTQPTLFAAPDAPQVAGLHFSGNLSPFGNGIGSSNTDSVNRKLGTVLENNYLWIKGKQTFNIGLEYRRTYQNDNECQNCGGNFYFSNNTTADPNSAVNGDLATTGNSFASFLLGQVDNANRIGTIEERLRNRDTAIYVQDDIKWSPKLTFNLGVRWDIMEPFTEIGNNIVYFNSKIPDPLADGLLGAATKFGNCSGCAGVDRASIKWDHITPRGGFSYQFNDKTVLQGGLSMNFLDGGAYEYGTSKVAVNYGNLLDGSTTFKSTNTTTPAFGSWDTNSLPLPSPIPFNSGLGTASAINAFDPNRDGVAPYAIVWSLGIQRELPYQMFLSASYTGNRGNRLTSQLNPIDQLDPKYLSLGPILGDAVNSPQAIAAGIRIPYSGFVQQFGGSATVLQALLPYPQFASIFNNFDDNGSALYNAMQIQVEKRYTNGLSFLVAYNLSRMMSNTGSGFTSFASASLNKNNQASEWSVDGNDQPQALNIAATYELPFGKGRRYLNKGGVANVVLGGWTISPLLTYASGTPLQVTVQGNPLGCAEPTCTSNRPNVNPGVQIQYSYSNVYSGQSVINPAAFSNPGVWAIGNEKRELSNLRNPFNYNENVALSKYFPIGEHVKLKLEVEYFNLLNRVVFGSPDTTLTDTLFGKDINNQNNTRREGQAHFEIRF